MSHKNSGRNGYGGSKRASSLPPVVILGGLAALAVVVVGLVWLALVPTGGGGAPKLQVDTERLDLGVQKFDHAVRASFTVRNMGTGTLTLSVPRSATLVEGC